MKKVLLMSITNKENWLSELQEIREIYRPIGKILVFEQRYPNVEDHIIWITFNCDSAYNFRRSGIIRINRNKHTNTLFTIDAINELSIRETGKIDFNFVPNWEEFNNCIVLKGSSELIIEPIKLIKTFDLT